MAVSDTFIPSSLCSRAKVTPHVGPYILDSAATEMVTGIEFHKYVCNEYLICVNLTGRSQRPRGIQWAIWSRR